MFEKIGEIIVPISNEHEMEKNDLNKVNDLGFIPWYDAHIHLPNVFKMVSEDELYLYSLPMNKKEQKYITINSASLIASSFEFEYGKLYKDKENLFEDYADRDEIKQIIKDNIDLFKNDNEKSLIKKSIGTLFNASLGMKNRKALSDYDKFIKPICDKFGYKNYIDEVSKEFVDTRNSIDHGNKDLKISYLTANAFYIERILIFCMQLKSIGFNDAEIQRTIGNVFEIF